MNRTSAYLDGKTLLITGATGFLGQPLVEKILSAAPGVARIHVLIRPKRQSPGVVLTPEKRLAKELYESSVFDRLRAVHGAGFDTFVRDKLVAVAGDISESGLGLDPEIAARLRQDTDVVISSAAVVSFDAPLDDALQLNVLGARRVAEFAASCRKAVLVHVSTAYVAGAMHQVAPETVYHSAPPGTREPFPRGYVVDVERDIAHIRAMIARCDAESRHPDVERELLRVLLERARNGRNGKSAGRRKAIESLRRKWLENKLVIAGMAWARERGWNDTYTYTKALGEQAVLRARGDMPTVIIRPSVIESSLSEPIPGWLDGLRMADPLIVAIGKGRLRSLPLNPGVHLDLVPVDMVVNALLAAVPGTAASGGLTCYQVATASRNPISLGDLYDLIYRYFVRNPMLDKSGRAIRIKYLRFPSKSAFRLQHRLRRVPLESAERALDMVSGFDAATRAKRRVSATRAALDKLYYYGEIYEPYLNMNCRFEVDRTMALYESLDDEEQKAFPFDVTRLNWRHYIQNVHIPGIKRYILKMEGDCTAHLEPPGAEPRPQTIGDLVARSAARFGDKPALQIRRGGDWQRISYRQLQRDAEAMRDRLQALGLRKGDRVVLWSENQPEWGVAALGAALLGVVIVPLDWQTWPPEAWAIARFTGARALLASDLCARRLTPEALAQNEAAAHPVQILDVNRGGAPLELADYPRSTRGTPVAPAAALLPVHPDDPSSIIFTSGTASDPKGAVHTHRSFLANVFGTLRLTPALDDTDEMLSVLPLYHALEFTCGFLTPLWLGATVTYGTALKPKALFETMRETGTTFLLGVPTLYALLRDDLERRVLKSNRNGARPASAVNGARRARPRFTRADIARVRDEMGGRLRFVVSGGSALGAELYGDFAALGIPIYEGYGLTETAPVLTFNPAGRSRAGSVGKPLPGVELRLSHPDGDGVGEIVVRTPSLMREYWANPKATAKAIRAGWLHTGDLGWVDEDGYVYISGRIKDVIVTGAGKNVYPADLEAIYARVPGVREIAVVGIRSGLTEEVHAVVVADPAELADGPGATPETRLRRELQALGKELPSYHRLQHVHVWPRPLPRDAQGDLRRDVLQTDLVARLESRAVTARRGAAATVAGGTGSAPAAFVARGTGATAGGNGGAAATIASADDDALLDKLARLSGVPSAEIRADSDLYGDLGLDSLEAVELLLFLESHYGVAVPDDRADAVRTVADLLQEVASAEAGDDGARVETLPSALPAAARTPLDRALLHWSLSSLETLYRLYFRFGAPQVEGALPATGAFIIAANHSSHLDVGAVLTAVATTRGRDAAARLHVLGARDYFFDNPLKGWFFSRFFNVVPIRREQTGLDGLRIARGILAAGEPVLIFPEATRSRTGGLQAFKLGLGLLAFETNAPIVPARIDGTYQALPAGRVVPRARPMRVRFDTAIPMERYRTNGSGRDEVYRRIVQDVRERIERLASGARG
jgi:long-chain acyl-CoA synthetase